MLELEDVTKIYSTGAVEVRALDGVSLHVDEGEMVAIMGHSGSGKSTMMNILGCLDAPTSGRYRLDGVDVGGLTDNQLAAIRNRKIGFVFQSFNLLPRTSAQRNVELPLVYAGEGNRAPARRRRWSASGSGRGPAHAQRALRRPAAAVAIARALVNDPAMILADEPTGALDSVSTDDVMRLLVELNEAGRTIVIITHEDDVASFTTRVVAWTTAGSSATSRTGAGCGCEPRRGAADRPARPAGEPAALGAHDHRHHHRGLGRDRAGRAGQRHPGRVHRAVLRADHADHRHTERG
jgi:putative ABC transport system ATP-binding protein